jgi:transposase-like protein
MSDTIGEKAASKDDQWRERIAEQDRSGMSVKKFCKEQRCAEHQFYYWRKRLRSRQQPVRFALVDRGATQSAPAAKAELELVLATGERLRIGTGVDATTLHTVLEALRT